MRQVLASALFGIFSLVSVSAMAGDADFRLVNATGYTINEVYVSAANKDAWGKDILGDGDMDNGKSRMIKFSNKANCMQDLKVVFDAGGEAIWEDLDLCEINKLTIKYDRATKKVSAFKE